MSQKFQVLRCSKCSTFQVHQVKKSNKWSCKMCGEKQSTICHYGTGTGRECRLHVQKLNSVRGVLEQSIILDPPKHEDVLGSNMNSEIPSTQTDSKWSKFVEKIATDMIVEPQVPESLHGVEAVLEISKERKRKFSGLEPKPFSKKIVEHVPKTRGKFEDTPDEENKPIHKNQYTSARTLIDFENGCGSIEHKIEETTNISRMPNQIETQTQEEQELRMHSKYEPVKVNKNSKWAQFVENYTCDEGNLHPENTTYQNQNLSQTIFSEYSDDDLDALLDI